MANLLSHMALYLIILTQFVQMYTVNGRKSHCLDRKRSSDKKHILLFLMDDLGYDDVSYKGAEYSTPNIDALAAAGSIIQKKQRINTHITKSFFLFKKNKIGVDFTRYYVCIYTF